MSHAQARHVFGHIHPDRSTSSPSAGSILRNINNLLLYLRPVPASWTLFHLGPKNCRPVVSGSKDAHQSRNVGLVEVRRDVEELLDGRVCYAHGNSHPLDHVEAAPRGTRRN